MMVTISLGWWKHENECNLNKSVIGENYTKKDSCTKGIFM